VANDDVPGWARTVGSLALMVTILIVVGLVVARSPSEGADQPTFSDSAQTDAGAPASDTGNAASGDLNSDLNGDLNGVPGITEPVLGNDQLPTSVTFQHIWPFAATRRFASAQDAALSFAIDYLGMTGARPGQTFTADPGLSTAGADVEIFPTTANTQRTMVHAEQDPVNGWVVIGSSADQIVVDQPKPHDPVTSPLDVKGQATSSSGQLRVRLLSLGSNTAVLTDTAFAGNNGAMAPFESILQPPAIDKPLVLVVSASDPTSGQVSAASVVLLGA
jgi:hypothetical protein